MGTGISGAHRQEAVECKTHASKTKKGMVCYGNMDEKARKKERQNRGKEIDSKQGEERKGVAW